VPVPSAYSAVGLASTAKFSGDSPRHEHLWAIAGKNACFRSGHPNRAVRGERGEDAENLSASSAFLRVLPGWSCGYRKAHRGSQRHEHLWGDLGEKRLFSVRASK